MAHPPKNRRKPGAHHRPPKEKGRALAAFTGAAPAEIRFGMERETRDLVGRMLKIGFGLLCVPLSWITFETLFILVTHSVSPKGFWMTKEFAYYGLGAAIWLAFFFNLRFPTFTYLYVLGHEYTHAAAALVCRGNVTDIKVTPDGKATVNGKEIPLMGGGAGGPPMQNQDPAAGGDDSQLPY